LISGLSKQHEMKPLIFEECHKAMFKWFSHQGVQGTCFQSDMHENANILWCMWNGRWFQCFFGLHNTVQAVACHWRGSCTM